MMPARTPAQILSDVVEELMAASGLSSLTKTVARAARDLAGADGATFVLRDGDLCHYADENAISPLWAGKRFPLESCISGWSMLNRKTVLIRDIYQDQRIPHDAYRPTFVKSLCMIPIRVDKPLGAIGTYWKIEQTPAPEQIHYLEALANSAAVALENLGLKQRVLNSGAVSADLTARQAELEAAFYALAHDLRNPLSTMQLLAQMLQSSLPNNTDPAIQNLCSSILSTGQRAAGQINRMLTLYRSTQKQLSKEICDLSALVQEVAEQQKVKAFDRKVHVDIETGLKVSADPVLIRIALDNLIDNAFKYTGKTPSAEISFRKTATDSLSQTFVLKDNGAGFDPDQAGRLFRPLVRLHKDEDFKGTGVGLASVARIIELHGGRIWAEGRPHQGAAFFLSLPVN